MQLIVLDAVNLNFPPWGDLCEAARDTEREMVREWEGGEGSARGQSANYGNVFTFDLCSSTTKQVNLLSSCCYFTNRKKWRE